VTLSGLPSSFIDGQPGTSLPGNTAVHVHAAMSAEEVAQAVANAIGRATTGYSEQIVAAGGSQIFRRGQFLDQRWNSDHVVRV